MRFSKEERYQAFLETRRALHEEIYPIYTKDKHLICFILITEYAQFTSQMGGKLPGEYIEENYPEVLKREYTSNEINELLSRAYEDHCDNSDEKIDLMVKTRIYLESKKDIVKKIRDKYPKEYFGYMYPA